MEAAYIVTEENVNSAPGSFRLSKVAETYVCDERQVGSSGGWSAHDL